MKTQPVLINGEWIPSSGTETFQSVNPQTREPMPRVYPVSPADEIERAVQAAAAAFDEVKSWPGERFARFLECYAKRIEKRADDLVETAHQETALPVIPRLRNVEFVRTTNQLKQAAAAANQGSWALATIDSATNIRSMYGSIGPVSVFGPNNFPFAFNGISGGDFAAAVAAGNPVIAKGHSSHPQTTQIFAEEALEALRETDMPLSFVQLIYRTKHQDGPLLVAHPLIGASGYTGSRHAGLVLKEAADKAGKPIYLELSSINPVFVLPGAIAERLDALADEFTSSCLMAAGQFCTNPGLVVLENNQAGKKFIEAVAKRFSEAPVGTLLNEGVERSLDKAINALQKAGAEVKSGGKTGGGNGYSYQNTMLAVDADRFLQNPAALQTEAFGNSSLFVTASDIDQMVDIVGSLEGNLTGAIYSDTTGKDDLSYEKLAPALRRKVGRLLNDKMPTGVAVSPAMNHGGPYPATGHPAFTAVGIPASLCRFATLQCYDNVRPSRLPPALQDKNPNGSMWRLIDGAWTQANVEASKA